MSAGSRLPGTPAPTRFWMGFGGVRIAGDSWGDPKGPLVLLQHGGAPARLAHATRPHHEGPPRDVDDVP